MSQQDLSLKPRRRQRGEYDRIVKSADEEVNNKIQKARGDNRGRETEDYAQYAVRNSGTRCRRSY